MSSHKKNVIAIRREDLSKKGEKRVAVSPSLAGQIQAAGHHVLVQPGIHPSGELKRAFADAEYEAQGAFVTEDISAARVVFGLKEIDLNAITPQKTWVFFSHTHKGQKKNRKMLRKLVETGATLIDYELIVNDAGARTVTAFTYFAGYAGMIDTLWTLGRRWAMDGIPNAFEAVPQSIEKEDLGLIKNILAQVADEIRTHGTPATAPPVIVGILGDGKTSTGAQEILDILPVVTISPADLEQVFRHGDRRRIYKLVLTIPEMYRLRETAGELQAVYQVWPTSEKIDLYLKQPQLFESNLEPLLPWLTMLMNCILWSPDYPRTLPRDLMRSIWTRHRYLRAIGDITCDPEGSIEFSKETWIDNPVYIYDPANDATQDGFEGEGVAVMAVTNLPCEFSADASEQFSRDLSPIMQSICAADYDAADPAAAGLAPEAQRATILWQGQFTPAYRYMQAFLGE